MSKKTHESGSDRIAEAIADMEVDIVVNVQGDEPFVKREPLERLLEVFDGADRQECTSSITNAGNERTKIY